MLKFAAIVFLAAIALAVGVVLWAIYAEYETDA